MEKYKNREITRINTNNYVLPRSRFSYCVVNQTISRHILKGDTSFWNDS